MSGSDEEIELEYGLRQCLPVAKLKDIKDYNFSDVQLESLTPEKYLAMVHLEAQKCPQIVTSDKIFERQAANDCKDASDEDDPIKPIQHKLDIDWVYQYLLDFQEVRENFQQAVRLQYIAHEIPVTLSTEKWLSLCFGNKKQNSTSPKLSIIQAMSEAQIEFLIECLVEHLEQEETDLNENIFQWLFALFVALQFPLQPSTYSSIRCLLRNCVNLLKDEQTTCRKNVNQIKVIVAICGGYFGQSQLLCSLLDFEQY
eukprot:TRINITY_DN23962_c0_g1_i2.p2 TRINITY_DN23962_c0_g1~~TRINITY_DN23962_c0_g1_i2.p2  ORF type:complete len:285 (+),score=17.02 TRINITY_DN23962_c0_g1_i2:89-856(+)